MTTARTTIDNYLSEEPWKRFDRVRPALLAGLKKLKIPKILFHLTPRDRLPKILRSGLKVRQVKAGGLDVGSDFNQLGIYLSNDSKEVLLNTDIHNPAELTIDSTKLDRNSFELDPEFYYDNAYDDVDLVLSNLKSGRSPFFLVYKKDIPVEAIVKVDRKYFHPDLMDYKS